jgi:hypothetical protein
VPLSDSYCRCRSICFWRKTGNLWLERKLSPVWTTVLLVIRLASKLTVGPGVLVMQVGSMAKA